MMGGGGGGGGGEGCGKRADCLIFYLTNNWCWEHTLIAATAGDLGVGGWRAGGGGGDGGVGHTSLASFSRLTSFAGNVPVATRRAGSCGVLRPRRGQLDSWDGFMATVHGGLEL